MTSSQQRRRSGSTIVESCAVVFLLALILFAALQVSLVTAAHDVLVYSSAAGSRCLAVGYDNQMAERAVRIGSLPNMGARPFKEDEEDADKVDSLSYGEEIARVKEYLMGNYDLSAAYNSLFWDSLTVSRFESGLDTASVEIEQEYPLVTPMRKIFYGGETVLLDSFDSDGNAMTAVENHSSLYLEQ